MGHLQQIYIHITDSVAPSSFTLQTLERHQGPVLCFSFDQWHLVTGSSDGYALGWSMLGKCRRCLMAFYHPK